MALSRCSFPILIPYGSDRTKINASPCHAGLKPGWMEMMEVSQTMSVDSFEFRELLFRGAKAINITVRGVEALSFSSATSNETHVVMFAGYLGNSRTSALFSYSLTESSPDLGLKPLAVFASGPRARSHVGAALPDVTTLLVLTFSKVSNLSHLAKLEYFITDI